VVDPATADRFLAAATELLAVADLAADDPLLVAAQRQRHAVLCSLGRLEDADAVYAWIERSCDEPTDLVEPACVQVAGLINRGRPRDAVELGMALLGRLGMDVPSGDVADEVARWSNELADWSGGLGLADDLSRPEPDRAVQLAASLISRLMPASFFCEPQIMAWLVLTSRRLWAEHGPCAPLVSSLSPTTISTIMLREDYRSGYRVVKHVLATGEARGYEPQTSYSRYILGLTAQHWFEPLEHGVQSAQLGREGMVRYPGMHMECCFTHYVSLAALLDTAPTLESCAADVETALAFATRSGNEFAAGSYLAYRQLIRAMQGGTDAPGSFGDDSFDEREHLASLSANPMAAAYFHIYRALAAALFDDTSSLIRHAAAAMPMLSFIVGFYPVALAHLVQGLALAGRARAATPDERPTLLGELDGCRAWLTARASDAPVNFGHLATLLDAERAWAAGDTWEAARAFDTARREVAGRQRPWHQALITERAAMFDLANGLAQAGQDLLIEVKGQYAVWCASGKVRQLDETYPFLRTAARSHSRPATYKGSASYKGTLTSSSISADEVDMLAILRTSQALSSETSLDRLRIRLGEVLRTMTGATTVMIALRHEDSDDWMLWDTSGGDAVTFAEPAVSGLVPMSAFRYAERTGEPLLLVDAVGDDRFAADPYLAGLERCSLLVVPLHSQGALRAMLVLENRSRRGAFSADRLDAVMLVTGQLTVSLDNAQLYASLERKVERRTAELEAANRALEKLSHTDALTGLINRRGFDMTLDVEWQRALHHRTPLTVAMIDVDKFKFYNDRYGHVAGDECLRVIGRALAGGLRQDLDVVCRYGGEEFAVILPGTDVTVGAAVAERIRAAVVALGQPHEGTNTGIVTISVGVASIVPQTSSTPAELVEAADGALYEAKQLGRNQVRMGRTDEPPEA
jgi:diguanylate cyclase (GGDEF)-like protein